MWRKKKKNPSMVLFCPLQSIEALTWWPTVFPNPGYTLLLNISENALYITGYIDRFCKVISRIVPNR